MNVSSHAIFRCAFSSAAVEPAVQVASQPQIVSLEGLASDADAGDVLIESLACGWRHSALLTGTRCLLLVHWRCFQNEKEPLLLFLQLFYSYPYISTVQYFALYAVGGALYAFGSNEWAQLGRPQRSSSAASCAGGCLEASPCGVGEGACSCRPALVTLPAAAAAAATSMRRQSGTHRCGQPSIRLTCGPFSTWLITDNS